jgi:phage terminase large subunit GpA-like protein
MGHDDIREVTLLKSARVGYALAIDTQLPTPSGWTTMGDVSVGDSLFDEQGMPCAVIYKSPVYINHDCYQIRFCDGSEIIADAGHLWQIEADQTIEYLTGDRQAEQNKRIGRPKLGQKSTKIGVISTEVMAKALHTFRGRNAITICNAKPLLLPDADLPIPPYTLGLWLGDGNRESPRITQHRHDVETALYIKEEGIDAEIRYIDKRYPNNATIFLDIPKTGRQVSPWAQVFKKMGLTTEKHIPDIYFRSSVAQRLSLLRGLMDSDGTIGKNGRAEFSNTNEKLAKGVYELVSSLGMKASIRHRPPHRDGVLDQYRVNFKAIPEINPFRINRKSVLVLSPEKPSITYRRRVVAVEKIAPVPVQCVQVNSASSLFLAGRQMVPTHNTKMVLAAIGYFAEHKRRNQAIWQPVDDDADEFVKTELDPMIRDVPAMQRIFPWYNSRSKHNTLRQKTFLTSMLHIRGGRSAKNYRRLSLDVAILDELDGFEPDVESEGSPDGLASKRLEGATFPKLICGSTPRIEETSLIAHRARYSGRIFRYHIACPHCQTRQPLEFGGKHEAFGLKWHKDQPETVAYLCSDCGATFTQSDYLRVWDAEHGARWQDDDGIWLDQDARFWTADNQPVPPPQSMAFKVWTIYSPQTTWRAIVEDWLRCQNDPIRLRTFVNTTLGQPWTSPAEKSDPDALLSRRENYTESRLPADVLYLTAGVDVQDNRLECEIVGWRQDRPDAPPESWGVAYHVLSGDPARTGVWGDLDTLLTQEWTTEDGRKLRVQAACVDSGGHHTSRVYAWCEARKGRHIYATKGLPGASRPIWRQKAGKSKKYQAEVWHLGVDAGKDAWYSRLKIAEPGPGYCHFPLAYDETYFAGLTAEQVRTKYRQGRPFREWFCPKGKRNEPLDIRVLALAALLSRPVHWAALAAQTGSARAPSIAPKAAPRKTRFQIGAPIR